MSISFIISFLVTSLMLPKWIIQAKKYGFTGKDMNKYREVRAAEGGGLTVVAGFILGILIYVALKKFYFTSNENVIEIFAITTSILILALIGLIDGSLGWKIGLRRRFRILLCLFAAVPLMVINAGQSAITIPLIGHVNMGLLYPLILIPLGIVATSTTFNFLAGYNGLESGQGIIMISALSLVAYLTGSTWLALIGLIMVFSLIAFWIYNKYPAKVFPGDVMTYPVGGMIAIMAILGNFERIALFFFIPYIIEVILKARGKLVKQSFGKPNKDGSLDLRYSKIYGLEHFVIYLHSKLGIKPTEKKVVCTIHVIQIVIIAFGFFLFREHIFSRL